MATAIPKIFSAYGPKRKVALSFVGEGRTKQSFKAECDINNIMKRYLKTGILDFVSKHAPRYGDCRVKDYQDSMLVVAEARSMFEAMPAELRARFNNEPAEFLAFMEDERNKPEAIKLGLLKEEVIPENTAPASSGRSTEPREASVVEEAPPPVSTPPGATRAAGKGSPKGS